MCPVKGKISKCVAVEENKKVRQRGPNLKLVERSIEQCYENDIYGFAFSDCMFCFPVTTG